MLPDNCNVTNCPMICFDDGSCQAAPADKERRYKLLSSLDWKHDKALNWQFKQLKVSFEAAAAEQVSRLVAVRR
jgi:hypothetical protein